MITRRYCYQLDCDDCTTPAGEHDAGYLIHFDNDRDALDWAADHGWTITDDGHIRCPRCTAQNFCASLGHHYGPWQPCTCRAQLLAHYTAGCPLVRICQQCGHDQEATLDQLTSTRPGPAG